MKTKNFRLKPKTKISAPIAGKRLRVKKNGFTLVEMLVAIVISGMMLVTVMTSFWLFIQSLQRAELNREVQRQARFALSRVADKTRNFALDYREYQPGGACPPSINQNHKLCLEGHTIEFKDDGLWLDEQPLLSLDNIKVSNAFFDFSPGQDPRLNLGELELQIQPKVTVFLALESKKVETVKLDIQTTLSSRKYQ